MRNFKDQMQEAGHGVIIFTPVGEGNQFRANTCSNGFLNMFANKLMNEMGIKRDQALQVAWVFIQDPDFNSEEVWMYYEQTPQHEMEQVKNGKFIPSSANKRLWMIFDETL